MLLRDTPRPVGYWPGTPSQWREATVDDCAWYATEAAFEAASETHRSVHPVKGLRAFSSDTEGGTPLSVAINETQRLWPASERVVSEYGAFTRDYLELRLQRGAMLVLGGFYNRLPAHYKRWVNNKDFAHAMACKTYRMDGGYEKTFLYDPLGGGPLRGPYDGEWITLDALLDGFNWKVGSKFLVGIVENQGDEPVQRLFVSPTRPADKEVRVVRGTSVRKAPRTTAAQVRRVWSETFWLPLVGTASNGWRLIAWDLAGDPANIGYIYKDDILETRDTPTPPVTGDTFDEDAYKVAVSALQEQVTDLAASNLAVSKELRYALEDVEFLKAKLNKLRVVIREVAALVKNWTPPI